MMPRILFDEEHAYQEEAYNFCLQRLYVESQLGAGLFLDPGLGKTLITLAVLRFLRDMGEIDSVLIVAPMRVCRLVWAQEICKWGFSFTTNLLCQRVKAGLKKRAFIDLINPESLHLVKDHCHRWDMIVIDESTKFKTWTSRSPRNRMKMMRKMLPNFKKRLILTGTPAPNSLADLHSQIFILDNGAALGRNVTVFRSLYCCQGGWQGRQWLLRENQEDKILAQIASMCLRLDAETCLDMPELIVNDIECELPPRCVAQYKKLQRDLLAQLDTGTILIQNAASAYTKMRQFANGQMYDVDRVVHPIHKAKLDALTDLVDELGGKPILVFYQFQHDLEAIRTKYPKAPVINGKSKKTDEKTINDWNAGKTHVLLAQNQAVSHGLNMQGCGTDMAYYGLHDSLEVYDQSYRRIYRQGVEGHQVRIHRLLTHGTVDTTIRDRLESKDQTQQAFLNNLKEHAKEGLL